MLDIPIPRINQDQMAYAISALCKVVDSELTRLDCLPGKKQLDKVVSFLLEKYTANNWFATFTAVNIENLVSEILQDTDIRAFSLNLAERVSFYWGLEPSPGYEDLVTFLAYNSAVNTPYEESFLNQEVYLSLKVDQGLIANSLRANPWIGVLIYAIRHLESTDRYIQWRTKLLAYVPPSSDDVTKS